MKKLLLSLAILSLVGCSTTVPVKAKFPDAPGKLSLEKCPNLTKLNDDAKLSDVAKNVTQNYSEYYTCAVKLDSWIEWYNIQKNIYESVK
jgi:hypothetical protein